MDHPHLIRSLKSDVEKLLYVSCSKFTKLSAVLRLYNFNEENEWSDKSFTVLLSLLKDMFPEANELPNRTCDSKKILCSIDMNYERIHAYPNDCILYIKGYEGLERCPVCDVDRYMKNKNKISTKVLWYFPVIPKFKSMFKNSEHAKSLLWHLDEKISNNMLHHLAD